MPSSPAPALDLQDRSAIEAQIQASGMTIAQLQAMARQSGMSQAQIRQRLVTEGYDPALVDELFLGVGAGLEVGTTAPSPFASDRLVEALSALGLLSETNPRDQGAQPAEAEMEETEDGAAGAARLRVFGSDVFGRGAMEPVHSGPAGADYVLGPGDALLVVLAGDVERVHRPIVTREGVVIMPRVGQMVVSGLSLAEFEDRLEQRLRAVYSDVGRDASARIRFSVSIGRLRTIQVHVVGAVTNPGSYLVSSVATLIDALYRAGGPTSRGSYRHVRLVRGNEVIEADLYPYITSGGPGSYPRLRGGDVVHVPWVGKQVTVRGQIRNPAVYELRDGESLADVLGFAGGLLPTGRSDLANVERILPLDVRGGLTDRVFMNAPLDSVLQGAASFPLEAGDDVEVLPIRERVLNLVSVSGAVSWAGAYELEPGMRLSDLLARAGGLTQDAHLSEIQIVRVDVSDESRTMIRHDLSVDPAGPLLVGRDEVIVFSKAVLRSADSVSIEGHVRRPGRYPFVEGMTAGDMIMLAGGYTIGAVPWRVEISRLVKGETMYETETVVSGVRPTVAGFLSSGNSSGGLAAVEVPLQSRDRVFVRGQTGYDVAGSVVFLSGQFVSPGTYVLETAEERLSSMIARAGGLTDVALQDIRIVREGATVAVDYGKAVTMPGSIDDPIMRNGDEVIAPLQRNTVVVGGAVAFATEVTFRAGLSVPDMISEAGGFAEDAYRDGVSVSYPDGSRATTKKTLGLFRSYPRLRSGARIFVPTYHSAAEGFDWSQAVATVLQLSTAVATLIIATNSAR